MTTTDDQELLREYASRSSEPAFATLVSRHVDMVYSVALRCVGNHHQAEEITQAVFVVLARKAGSLRRGTVLSGWLFHTARLTTANFIRTETRRARREQEAFMQSHVEENQTEVWQQIAPLLDDAIADLGEKDRNAVVLRFVKGKDYTEVGEVLGASQEAAQCGSAAPWRSCARFSANAAWCFPWRRWAEPFRRIQLKRHPLDWRCRPRPWRFKAPP